MTWYDMWGPKGLSISARNLTHILLFSTSPILLYGQQAHRQVNVRHWKPRQLQLSSALR